MRLFPFKALIRKSRLVWRGTVRLHLQKPWLSGTKHLKFLSELDFLFVLEMVINQANILWFTFENSFYSGTFQLVPSSCKQFHLHVIQALAYSERYSTEEEEKDEEEEWCKVCLDPVRILLDDPPSVLWSQLGPWVLKVIFNDWSQQNNQKGPISVQNYFDTYYVSKENIF